MEGGRDPNRKEEIADTYIENLQQQIYFMELELKILKEKVIEDEKSSGIGGLFDDEKTSHEHITLLKTKYQDMRREFDRVNYELDKARLETMGDKFMLAAQWNTNKEQTKETRRKNDD